MLPRIPRGLDAVRAVGLPWLCTGPWACRQLRQRPRMEPGRVRGVDRRHALPPADGPGRGL